MQFVSDDVSELKQITSTRDRQMQFLQNITEQAVWFSHPGRLKINEYKVCVSCAPILTLTLT
jgi:hypothetical protein